MVKIVAFDGLNLALTRGTGVATYTRTVARLAEDLGYETAILYDTQKDVSKDLLLREVNFFDARGGDIDPPLDRMIRAGFDIARDISGVRTQDVPLSGTVITRPLESNWVDPQHVFAARDVFGRARRHFAVFKRLLPVSTPQPIDLMHWTYPIPARKAKVANLYTIHDLVPLRMPYTTLDWKRFFLKSTRKIVEQADHIITVSEHSKQDIIKYLEVDEKRISNLYQSVAIPDQIKNRSDKEIESELSGVFSLEPDGYFLFYGSLEPKKNLGRIVEAYLASNVKYPLVVIVAQKWRSKDEIRLLAQAQVKSRKKILQFDYMPFRLLMTLIQGARGVLYPSLYEGFGLPILEAMTLKTPVITSKESSMPEVAGDAALLVDPYDTEDIRRAIGALAEDDDLRRDLSERGEVRAQEFSMEKFKERLGSVYARYT